MSRYLALIAFGAIAGVVAVFSPAIPLFVLVPSVLIVCGLILAAAILSDVRAARRAA